MTNMGSEMNGSERWLISLHAAFVQMLEKDHCSFGEIVLLFVVCVGVDNMA